MSDSVLMSQSRVLHYSSVKVRNEKKSGIPSYLCSHCPNAHQTYDYTIARDKTFHLVHGLMGFHDVWELPLVKIEFDRKNVKKLKKWCPPHTTHKWYMGWRDGDHWEDRSHSCVWYVGFVGTRPISSEPEANVRFLAVFNGFPGSKSLFWPTF